MSAWERYFAGSPVHDAMHATVRDGQIWWRSQPTVEVVWEPEFCARMADEFDASAMPDLAAELRAAIKEAAEWIVG